MPEIPFSNTIKSLAEPAIPSPLSNTLFVGKEEYQLYDTDLRSVEKTIREGRTPPCFEHGGPRENIFFDPQKTKAALVTCGGLCPGLNDVIRSVVMELYYHYHVEKIIGFRYGYNGIKPNPIEKPLYLTPEDVEKIHNQGGTILGTSRGAPDYEEVTDHLERNKIDILFSIGGDGTLAGAHKIAHICLNRKNGIAIIGIPKTIDNDILYTSRTFGFLTAVEEARKSVTSIHNEATSLPNGVGILKLMGRDSGFIAANATLSNNQVNYCLIPEADFDLDGEKGLLNDLKYRLEKRRHAVIVVAEGAGQKFFNKDTSHRDESGNIQHKDIGVFLRDSITEYGKRNGIPISVKYVDPSYTIRSHAANAEDSAFCLMLGQNAVHAAMAGKTDMIVSSWNNTCVHVPIEIAISARKKIDPASTFWHTVLNATGQRELKNR